MGTHLSGLRRGVAVAAASIIGATVALVGSGTASADRPLEAVGSEVFTDVNPCTGLDHEITLDLVFRVHLHDGREVVHVTRTGSTDSGYVMEQGVQIFVLNGRVIRAAFTDNWQNSDGSIFKAQGTFVANLTTGDTLVDRFSLRCIAP